MSNAVLCATIGRPPSRCESKSGTRCANVGWFATVWAVMPWVRTLYDPNSSSPAGGRHSYEPRSVIIPSRTVAQPIAHTDA